MLKNKLGGIMARIYFSQRASRQIRQIEKFSKQKWGIKTAGEYKQDIGSAINRISYDPNILKNIPYISSDMKYYVIRSHVMIFQVKADDILFLSIMHSSMDIETRLLHLEPMLLQEAQILLQRINLPSS